MVPLPETLLSAEKLNRLLSSRKISQEQLAERLGCSDRQIRNWTAKDTNAHIASIIALAEVLDVDIHDLLVSCPTQDGKEVNHIE